MAEKRMTAKERMHLAAYADAVRMLEFDSLDVVRCAQRVPDEWHAIHDDPDTFAKRNVKVTFLVGRDALAYFKTMGPGHGKRMNRVLTAHVHGRLAGIVDGPCVTDFVQRPERVKAQIGEKRPGWGESSWWEELQGQAEPPGRCVRARTLRGSEARRRVRDFTHLWLGWLAGAVRASAHLLPLSLRVRRSP